MYEGIKEWNLYCPAVSHNWILSVLFSIWTVLETKSTPTVGCIRVAVPARCRCSYRRWTCWWWRSSQQIGPQRRPPWTSELACPCLSIIVLYYIGCIVCYSWSDILANSTPENVTVRRFGYKYHILGEPPSKICTDSSSGWDCVRSNRGVLRTLILLINHQYSSPVPVHQLLMSL